MTVEQGLALFDAALGGGPVVVPVRLDLRALGNQPELPTILRGLVRTRARRAAVADASGWVQRLAGLSAGEQRELVLELVRGQIAVVLGHAGADTIDPDKAFQDLGFDSLTAIELRNRINTILGVRLPATVLFDYPTIDALVGHLLDQVAPPAVSGGEVLLAELAKLERSIGELEVGEDLYEQIAGRLEVLRTKWGALRAGTESGAEFDFESASDEEVFDLLDNELGLS